MTLATLNERIANAEAKIAKKTATIEKKKALIEKKTAKLEKLEGNEKFWTECEIKHLHEDIERNESEIAEITKSLEGYRAQTGKANEDEQMLKEIPENMKQMQVELVEKWNEYDKQRREQVRKAYNELGWREFHNKFSHADYELRYKTDEEINKENERDARALILDLIRRVKNITGEITSWAGVRAEIGTWGFTVLNGVVEGKQGRCVVESIFAGGYNIQRLHVRVLTKEIA